MIIDGPCCPLNKCIVINCYSRSSKHENALIRILRIGGKICEICQHLSESIRHRIKPYVLCPNVYLCGYVNFRLHIPSFRFGFNKFAINVTVSFCYNFFFQSMNKVVSVLRRFLTLVVLTFCYFLNVYIFGDYYH